MPARAAATLTLLALTALGLGGCAGPAQVRGEAVPVRIFLGADAAGAARALARQPYLKVAEEDGRSAISARARASSSSDPRASELAGVRAGLGRARESYRRLRFAEALAELGRAQAVMAQLASAPAELELLGELAQQEALNHLALEQREAAERALSLAFALGHRGPAEGQLPPRVESFIAAARQARASAARAPLRIATSPAGAEIFLDGRPAGRGPTTVTAAVGLHHLRVATPGYRATGSLVRVEARGADASLSLERAPSEDTARELLGSLDRGGAPAPELLLRVVGAPAGWLAVSAAAAGRQAELLWARGDRPPLWLRCSGASDDALGACLGPQLYRAVTGKDPAAPSGAQAARVPIYKRWWFWTAIGAVVVAGAGTGIYFGARKTGTDVSWTWSAMR